MCDQSRQHIDEILQRVRALQHQVQQLKRPVIVKRGRWTDLGNPDFGRCHWCGGLTLRGICQGCGVCVECAWCGKVKLPDGSFARVAHMEGEKKNSHGICPECKTNLIKKEVKHGHETNHTRTEINSGWSGDFGVVTITRDGSSSACTTQSGYGANQEKDRADGTALGSQWAGDRVKDIYRRAAASTGSGTIPVEGRSAEIQISSGAPVYQHRYKDIPPIYGNAYRPASYSAIV